MKASRLFAWLARRSEPTARTKIQFMSDLHLELLLNYLDFSIPVSAPYLLLAGDIGRFSQFEKLEAFVRRQCIRFEQVFFLPGNHEPYGMTRARCLDLAQQLEQSAEMQGRLVILERKRVELSENVTLLGCTLHSHLPAEAKEIVSTKVNDFRKIDGWSIDDHNTAHARDLTWLKAELAHLAAAEPDRKIVIATHAGTSYPRNASNPWRSAFSTEVLSDFNSWPGAKQVTTWVFGGRK